MTSVPASAPNSSVGAENVTDFMLAPGETGVYGQRFLVSILAPYLKAQMMCSTTRFVYKVPHTLLGIIPTGTDENTVPLSAIAAVSTSSHFRVGRAIVALALFLGGASMFSSSVFGAILCILLAALFAVTCMPQVLLVTNHAGGAFGMEVSILDKAKLKMFKTELQNRVFADLSQMRHGEAQDLRMQTLAVQQMQLAQMQSQQINQQNQMRQGQQQVPGGSAPAAGAAPGQPQAPSAPTNLPPTPPAGV